MQMELSLRFMQCFTDVQTATARNLFDVASSGIFDKFVSSLVNKRRIHNVISFRGWHADKCIGFCIEEDGGFVGMYELVVNDKVQRENINSINYFRDDKLVQQAISDMEKLMAARQQSKEQERSSTKKSVLDALRSLKAKKQEQPAQEQDKPKKAKTKGMEL